MEVIVKKTIVEELNEKIQKAKQSNREIDYILVSKGEAVRLYREIRDYIDRPCYQSLPNPCGPSWSKDHERACNWVDGSFYTGIRVKVNWR